MRETPSSCYKWQTGLDPNSPIVCLHLQCAGPQVGSCAKEHRASCKIKHSKLGQSQSRLGSLNSALLRKFFVSPALTAGGALTELCHSVFYGSICLTDCALLKPCPEDTITESVDDLFFAASHYNVCGLHK